MKSVLPLFVLWVFGCSSGEETSTNTPTTSVEAIEGPTDPTDPTESEQPLETEDHEDNLLSSFEISAAGRRVIEALAIRTTEELEALKESEYLDATRRVDPELAAQTLREIKMLMSMAQLSFAREVDVNAQETAKPATTPPEDGLVVHTSDDGAYRVLLLDQEVEPNQFADANLWRWLRSGVRIEFQVRPAPPSDIEARLLTHRFEAATLSRGAWGMLGEVQTSDGCYANYYDAALNLVAYARASTVEESASFTTQCETLRKLALSLSRVD